jgi:hypothetical protein
VKPRLPKGIKGNTSKDLSVIRLIKLQNNLPKTLKPLQVRQDGSDTILFGDEV